MIYELRTYHLNPGKLDALCRRFNEHTLRLFKRHGMKVVNFWIDADGKETLYYVMEFKDNDEKDRLWQEFISDPEWIKAKADSEVDGKLVAEVISSTMKIAPFFK